MRARACVCAGEVARGGNAHARAGEVQQGCLCACSRVNSSAGAHEVGRTRVGAGALACVQVGSGANVAQSNRGGTSHNFRLPHLSACARPCVREVDLDMMAKML